MNPANALSELKKSIDHHGLTGWSAGLDTAVRRFGVCNLTKKHISLSRQLCELNSDEEVHDTILHEVAHALAYERYGENCGHDRRWKDICIEIGAKPERCCDSTVVQPDAPWLLVHKESGEVFGSYYKKPSRDWSRVWIRGRKGETLGQLIIQPHNQLDKLNNGQDMADTDKKPDPILSFTPQTVLKVQEDLVAMMKQYAKQHGLELSGAKCSYHSQSCDYTLSLSVPSSIDAEEMKRLEFETLAPLFDLTEDDYQREFRLNGRRFTLVALKPNNRKYPIIGADESGKRYKFTLDVIEEFQQT